MSKLKEFFSDVIFPYLVARVIMLGVVVVGALLWLESRIPSISLRKELVSKSLERGRGMKVFPPVLNKN